MTDKSPSPPKKCQLTAVMLCSIFWISWPLRMGLIGCPKTLVTNYHSTLCNISEKWRSNMTIWWCRAWFGPAWSGPEQSSLVQPIYLHIIYFVLHLSKYGTQQRNYVIYSSQPSVIRIVQVTATAVTELQWIMAHILMVVSDLAEMLIACSVCHCSAQLEVKAKYI
jgi:hypothetical protein